MRPACLGMYLIHCQEMKIENLNYLYIFVDYSIHGSQNLKISVSLLKFIAN